MNFQVTRAALSAAISTASAAVPKKTVLPILENLRLECDGNRTLYITGSDQNITIQSTVFVENCTKGTVCIPAFIINDLMKNIPPKEDLSFEQKNEDTIEVKWNNGMCSLPIFPAKDYPEVLTQQDMPLRAAADATALAELLEAVSFAAEDRDELKPVFASVYLKTDKNTNSITAVASNRASISFASIEAENNEENNEGEVMLPKASTNLLRRFLSENDETVLIEAGPVCARFSLSGQVFECRTTVGNYLPYEKIIKTKSDKKLIIETESLLSSIRRVSICAPREKPGIIFNINSMGMIMIKGEDTTMNTYASEELTGSYEGEEIKITLPGDKLVELLSHFNTQEIQIIFTSENKPIIIHAVPDPTPDETTNAEDGKKDAKKTEKKSALLDERIGVVVSIHSV